MNILSPMKFSRAVGWKAPMAPFLSCGNILILAESVTVKFRAKNLNLTITAVTSSLSQESKIRKYCPVTAAKVVLSLFIKEDLDFGL